MKSLFQIYLFLILPGILTAQAETIYCNEFQNVVVMSPSPISQAVTGSEHFVFTYDKTRSDSIGLLQGKPGHPSNLVVRTMDGAVYTYTLKYRDSLLDYTYQINRANKISLIDSVTSNKKPTLKKKEIFNERKQKYYQKLSTYFATKAKKRLAVKRKDEMRIEVLGLQHHRDEVYVTFSIKNRSTINYEIGSLALFKVQGKKSRRSSFQKIRLEPLYTKKQPEIILKEELRQFTVVYPKFSLGEHQKLRLELNEDQGSRFIGLNF
ncbi:conjugative transposon protein TraN [Salegentibacter sp. LM13S]|uniref:DUF4138 domain-containing protein n=1 Tax=Salegentibacter lacus TaxID=2873599 RepID=UPI001CCBBF5D|nr:DUF4138 domain-containing protein [Salegentibacter lacus]MBZ9629776.1 conjugative transposon protein TraN [Salegentibacter lacus]